MTKPGKRRATQGNQGKAKQKSGSVAPKEVVSRRDLLGRFRNGALLFGVVGAAGWYVVSEVRAGIDEADLTKIGNGIPTVVQIHDPQCPVCQALQKEARTALEAFEDGELQYLVANIRQDKGRNLAAKHGVPHVTLLLFDGKGERKETLSGPNTADYLEEAFRRHLESEKQS